MMTEEQLAEIEKRAKDVLLDPDVRMTLWLEDLVEEDIPALVAEVRRLRQQIADMQREQADRNSDNPMLSGMPAHLIGDTSGANYASSIAALKQFGMKEATPGPNPYSDLPHGE